MSHFIIQFTAHSICSSITLSTLIWSQKNTSDESEVSRDCLFHDVVLAVELPAFPRRRRDGDGSVWIVLNWRPALVHQSAESGRSEKRRNAGAASAHAFS